jgi:hypothetical protein
MVHVLSIPEMIGFSTSSTFSVMLSVGGSGLCVRSVQGAVGLAWLSHF